MSPPYQIDRPTFIYNHKSNSKPPYNRQNGHIYDTKHHTANQILSLKTMQIIDSLDFEFW